MLIKSSENEDSSEYLTVFKEQCVSYTMTKTSYLKYEMSFYSCLETQQSDVLNLFW